MKKKVIQIIFYCENISWRKIKGYILGQYKGRIFCKIIIDWIKNKFKLQRQINIMLEILIYSNYCGVSYSSCRNRSNK